MHLRQARWQNPDRFGLFVEGDGGSAGGAGGSGEGKVEEKKPDGVSKAEHDKAIAELKKFQDADAKRQADAKKKADQDAADNGKAADVLKQREAELEAAKARVAAFETREQARADKMLVALPKERQERLATFRDAMPLDKFVELLEAEPKSATSEEEDETTTPPFAGAGRDGGDRQVKEYKPLPKSLEVLEEIMGLESDPSKAFKHLVRTQQSKAVEDGEKPKRVFTTPVRKMFQQMKHGPTKHVEIQKKTKA